MDETQRQRLIAEHLDAVRDLEVQAAAESGGEAQSWPPNRFYLLWHVVIGLMLGVMGSIVSLVANVAGAPLFGRRPLELIRVYLTFPMGERALDAEPGVVLTVGCLLYLLTGALYGVIFHLVMSLYFADASKGKRFLVASGIGLALWIVNFYLVLSWLQPMLVGGNWIVELVPIWVGAATHLAFAWSMLVGEIWGRFETHRGSAVTAVFLAAALGLGGCVAQVSPPDESSGEEARETATSALEYPEWQTVAPGEHASYNQRATLVQRGHLVYQKYCVGCHGEHGDGNGPAAARLITRPRDFTSGIYKFRSTDSGSLPLEEDLHRTITRGLSRVSMPAFRLMPEGDKIALIEYVKGFYPRWERDKDQRRIVPIPSPPGDLATQERVLRGRVIYLQMQCLKCHGTDGRGTGATQEEYIDAWGDPQKPFDFTRGSLKGGNSPEDIYRTFHTGLRSIMPSYGGDTLAAVTADAFPGMVEDLGLDSAEAERLTPTATEFPADGSSLYSEMSESERLEIARRNSWDLVAYILSLRNEITTASAVLGTPADG